MDCKTFEKFLLGKAADRSNAELASMQKHINECRECLMFFLECKLFTLVTVPGVTQSEGYKRGEARRERMLADPECRSIIVEE